MPADLYINGYSIACALGSDKASVADMLFSAAPCAVGDRALLSDGRTVPVGRVKGELDGAGAETRTNRIIAQCYAGLAAQVEEVRERAGPQRLGVVIGTSTSGIGEGGAAVRHSLESGRLPMDFSLGPQHLGDSARFAASLCGAGGPCYVVSTACTSGARAIAAGARLVRAGLCDAVLCGGADSLCDLTLNGFAALDSLSDEPCNPMSVNRKGLNIGEGGALFLLTRDITAYRLAGWGESADGYHMSAPDPTGAGAEAAMRRALETARTRPEEIDFVHLHGTATRLNDEMEAGVVNRVFDKATPCASTKPLTGHTLGAAGAVQAGLCLLAMENRRLPPHLWDGARDPALPEIRLTSPGERADLRRVISASYAFGGNNAVLVLAAT